MTKLVSVLFISFIIKELIQRKHHLGKKKKTHDINNPLSPIKQINKEISAP